MKKIIIIFAVSLLFTTQLLSSSGGITGRSITGCTCHGTLSAGNAAITISATPDMFSSAGFAAGNTYKLTISVTGGPVGTKGGFNLKASAGSFSNPSASAKLQSGEVTQSNSNVKSWTVDWIAPTTPTDSVVFNFAGNAVNGDGDSGGDDPTVTARRAAYKTTSVLENELTLVNSFQLFQNYPNPFNSETTIGYQIDRAGSVELRIVDLTGRMVYETTQHHSGAGIYQTTWNAMTLQGTAAVSGVYTYQIKFNNTTQNRKLILLK